MRENHERGGGEMTLAELAQLGQFMGGAGVFITSLSVV
jgi:hypothetical protein